MQHDLFAIDGEVRTREATEGKIRKRIGLASVTSRNAMFLAECRAYARAVCAAQGSVTVEDVRRWARERGLEPEHANAWGGLFAGRHWQAIGDAHNCIASAHHRRIFRWRYIEEET